MAMDNDIYNEALWEEYREEIRILTKIKYIAGLSFSVFAIDRLFKESIESEPDEEFPKPLPGPLKDSGNYEKFHNYGFALGKMSRYPEFIKLTQLSTCLAVAGTLISEIIKKGNAMMVTGLSLILGGGLSNLFDRYKNGYVVDYINFHKKPLNKIIVNIGDIAIFFGGVLAVVSYFIRALKKNKT